MTKLTFKIAVCLTVLCASATSYAQQKLDPYIDAAGTGIQMKALSISAAPQAGAVSMIDVFIKTQNPIDTSEAVRAAGGVVRVSTGQILIASLPAEALALISELDDVIYVEASKPVGTSNDVAVAELGATEAHDGTGLDAPYTGKDVVIGIIDTGIDFSNADFKDADGKSRVISVWDQTRAGGPYPAEIGDSYGTECNSASISNNTCPLMDVEGHGTHVAGIAAGSDAKYGGVAPDAKIVAVRYDSSLDLETGYADTLFSTKICEAAYYVFTKADKLGMPAVVNLSLGTHIGAHDGTSLFEECLASLVKDSAGRALVAAAGNEYSSDNTYTGIHTGFSVTGSRKAASNFVIRTLTKDRIYYIDLWEAKSSNISVGLAINKGAPAGRSLEVSEMAKSGDRVEGAFLGGKIGYVINATETASPLNGKPHVGIRIILDDSITEPDAYSFDLVVSGSGSFDAWLFPDKPSKSIQFTSVSGNNYDSWIYIPGDRQKNIAIPSTSPDVISVAGYTTRNRWTVGSMTWSFNGQGLGQLLSFSSQGPSADPQATGQKPEIAAPGGMIASTLSSTSMPSSQLLMDDGRHVLQAGTSMAAPFVSGTIALMFQANPNFTHEDVKKYLIESSYADDQVGSVPNQRWGYGKLSTLDALSYAISGTASGIFGKPTSAVSESVSEEGSTGKSGCELTPLSTGNNSIIEFAMFAAAALAIAAMRRRTDIGN